MTPANTAIGAMAGAGDGGVVAEVALGAAHRLPVADVALILPAVAVA
jgi:hypothetical protein